MRTILTLAIFLVIGFIGSKGFVARSTHRLPLTGLLASGMEFFLLGLLAGPGAFNLITTEVIADLEPIIYLTLGWIGLLFGIELSWDSVRHISRSIFRFLFVDAAAALTLFSLVMFFVIRALWPQLNTSDWAVAAIVFGITASVSSPMVVALATQRLPSRGPLTNTIRIASSISALFPLVAFGVLFMVIHPRFFSFEGLGWGLLWWLFVNVVGVVMGFIMVLFTQERSSDNEMLLLILGTVFLIGGTGYYLELSPLYTAMIMGLVVGNFSRRRDQIFRELHRVEKTLYLGFLVIAGTMVVLPGLSTVAVIAVYVVLRLLMKYLLTGFVATHGLPDIRQYGRRVGLTLTGQGAMAMAIALECHLASSEFALQSVLTVVAIAVFINDIVGYLLTRRTLILCGEAPSVRPEATGQPGERES